MNVMESVRTKMAITELPIVIKVINTDIGQVEQLASWIRNMLLTYQLEIQNDFCLRRFRVRSMTSPKIYEEAKENFEVGIVLDVVFDENFQVQQDALRLKTVSSEILNTIGQSFTSTQ